MLKERDENFIEKALWVHSLFSPQIRTPPRVRRRIFLLLLYIIEILGKQATNVSIGRGESAFNLKAVVASQCNITRKDTLSALQRAQTNTCKQMISTVACKNINDSLYPLRLTRLCKNNVTSYGRHLGCFKDDEKTRILADSFSLFKSNNSPSICIDKCLQFGFQYAGVQYAIECFCGNKKPSEELLLHPNECNMKCPSSTSGQSFTENYIEKDAASKRSSGGASLCGGFFAMNVYETGIFHDSLKSSDVTFEGFQSHTGAFKPIRIVYLLTLNGRAYRQVIRLVKNLFHKQHFFYIHVDARQDYLFRELLLLNRKLPNNVRFVAKRRATIWGGASLLSVLLSAMEDLVKHADDWNWKWDYVINLSESDFPLKTTAQLEKFLSLSNGKNFIKSHGRDVQKFILKQGLDKTFLECENRMWRIGDRSLPRGIVIDGGSDWVALHREFVHYIITTNDTLVEGLKTVFKYTLLPAESFFHTVLRNSALCDTSVDNNLHVTNWKRKLGCKCQYRNVVDWCGCSPNDFRLNDWQRLQVTENRLLFFGRKFESTVSQSIVNNLESWLNPQRAQAHSKTSDRYWQSIYHHHDLSPKADDAVKALGFSLSRRTLKYLASIFFSKICHPLMFEQLYGNPELILGIDDVHYADLQVVEMNVYLRHDVIQGILVRFRGSIENLHIEAESWFTFVTMSSEIPNLETRFQGRIRNLQVGLDYDQKEQIFRHFARAMGPASEPTLAYNCISDETFNATFVWLNPSHLVQAVINISVPEGSTSNFIKPNLETPLLPGIWSVEVLSQDGVQLSQVEFIILPLQFYHGESLATAQNQFQDSIASTGLPFDRSELSSLQLSRVIDGLTSRMFVLEDACFVKETSSPKFQKNICIEKEWSSFHPDPKSTIDGIDKQTGFLVP